MHRLKDFSQLRSGREVAWCTVCNKVVGIVHKPRVGGGFVKRCENDQKAKAKAARGNEKRRERKAREKAAKALRDHAEWLWRQIAYHRAGFKCEICNVQLEPGLNGLQAHHLINRSQSKRLQLDPSNSQCLCWKCHHRAGKDSIWALSYAEIREPGLSAYLLSERRIIGARPFEEDMERLLKVAAIYPLELRAEKEAA